MLHKRVVLTQLLIRCPKKIASKTSVEQIAGQIRNHHYAWSFPWTDGSMGRVILAKDFDQFYGEHQDLCAAFYKATPRKEGERFSVELTVLPFPNPEAFPKDLPEQALHKAKAEIAAAKNAISLALETRFELRLRMLLDAIEGEKRFYESLIDELEKVVLQGIYLAGSDRIVKPDCAITSQLFGRLLATRAGILIYSAEDIRQSTSVKEDVLFQCRSILT